MTRPLTEMSFDETIALGDRATRVRGADSYFDHEQDEWGYPAPRDEIGAGERAAYAQACYLRAIAVTAAQNAAEGSRLTEAVTALTEQVGWVITQFGSLSSEFPRMLASATRQTAGDQVAIAAALASVTAYLAEGEKRAAAQTAPDDELPRWLRWLVSKFRSPEEAERRRDVSDEARIQSLRDELGAIRDLAYRGTGSPADALEAIRTRASRALNNKESA